MEKICVIGSLNMDLVAVAQRFPKPGETITGKEFGTYPGGKGANQAVAAGRLGAHVSMVGKLGDDFYGKQYLKVLEENGVSVRGVGIAEGVSSGIAVIEVDGCGENHIIIIPGANGTVDREYIDNCMDFILAHDIFLFQLEIPLDTVIYAMKKLKQHGKTIILDPAPARELPDEIFHLLDYITPNHSEMEILTGVKIRNREDLKSAAAILLERGVENIIAKAGRDGAYLISKREFLHIPGFSVEVVDTTAAGDSFNAGFALALARKMERKECVRFANAVGAISVTAKGAQGAMPTWEQVKSFMK